MILCDASECAAVQTISSCFIPPSLLPASLVCGIWHSDSTSVQSLWAPLSIFPLSLLSLTGLPDLLLPLVSSATSRLVLVGADIVLARSPSHQSPACGIVEHRKAPPWQMPVKTLFHPVLLSISLSFLVSWGQLWPRHLVFPICFPRWRPTPSDQCLVLSGGWQARDKVYPIIM